MIFKTLDNNLIIGRFWALNVRYKKLIISILHKFWNINYQFVGTHNL